MTGWCTLELREEPEALAGDTAVEAAGVAMLCTRASCEEFDILAGALLVGRRGFTPLSNSQLVR